ncbi:uncharacterized protein LOC26514635 isoform X2 [Drosophila ananassae]|uniref:uncharacterized protein LOC26514635 isoform X2 n=1 Tax=Drosophila ananassae TaxID=7217 RepID=UPI001CFFFB68|nr:uncharacterized protein LOC26514635 isoform X2 [Drosophila ananassae]
MLQFFGCLVMFAGAYFICYFNTIHISHGIFCGSECEDVENTLRVHLPSYFIVRKFYLPWIFVFATIIALVAIVLFIKYNVKKLFKNCLELLSGNRRTQHLFLNYLFIGTAIFFSLLQYHNNIMF